MPSLPYLRLHSTFTDIRVLKKTLLQMGHLSTRQPIGKQMISKPIQAARMLRVPARVAHKACPGNPQTSPVRVGLRFRRLSADHA